MKPQEILAWIVFLHGLRLTFSLLHREWSVKNMRDQVCAVQNRYLLVVQFLLLRIELALCQYGFSSFLSSETNTTRWYCQRDKYCTMDWNRSRLGRVPHGGKSNAKRRYGVSYGEERLVGPTAGLYALCQHSNFSGELFLDWIVTGRIAIAEWHLFVD